jgi:hypothetical protein
MKTQIRRGLSVVIRGASLLLLIEARGGLPTGPAGSLPVLNAPVVSTDGAAQIQVSGQPGTNYVLEGSADFTHWLDLAAAKAADSVVDLIDPFAQVGFTTEFSPERFYRVRTGTDDEVPSSIHATMGLNTRATVTAEVDLAGGSLVLTNSDGVIYQLQFPTDNPEDLENVTLAVVTQVSGLPVNHPLLAGINLTAEDPELIGELTLTVTRPGGFPSGSLGFACQAAGAEFHPYPIRVSGDQLVFHVHDIGGFGVLQAAPTDAAVFQQRPPTSLEDRIEQKVALIAFAAGGASGLSWQGQGTSSVQDATYAAESQFLDLAVDAELIMAETDEGLFDLATHTYADWYARVQDEGIADRFADNIAQANQYVVAAFENSINRKSQRCQQHDLGQILRMVNAGRIMGWQPWAPAFTAAVRRDLEDTIRRCATFQMDFDSLMINTSTAGVERSRTHADVTLQLGSPISFLSGQGTLAFTEAVPFLIPAPCAPVTTTPSSAPFNIPYCRLHLQMAPGNWSPTNHWRFKDARVDFILPVVHEGFYVICDGVWVDIPDFWYPEFGAAHTDELTAVTPPGSLPEAVFQITGWTPGGGEVIATKSYARSTPFNGGTVEEQTTLTLRHTPMP